MKIPVFFDKRFARLGWESNLRSFVIAAYTSPERHYHGLGHLARMIRELEDRKQPESVRTFEREILTATFFHDIVYDAKASDNEELSAVSARLWLDSVRHDLDLDLVEELILATKHHDVADLIPVYKRQFLIADISILWSQPNIYRWYAKGIRKEYAHVPAEQYRVGRAAVIARLADDLSTPKHRLDAAKNIKWETEMLEQGAFDVP